MSWLQDMATWAQGVLIPLGTLGLVPAAILDSSFLSLAGGVDVWLVTLCVSNAARTPLYVMLTVVGSVAGASLLYLTMKKGGCRFVEKKVSADKMERIQGKVRQHEAWAMFVAALLPPPAPFKLFVLAAGILQMPYEKFVLALVAGRTIRYSVAGFLAARYGQQVWDWLLWLGPWVLLLVILMAGVALGHKLLRKKAVVTD